MKNLSISHGVVMRMKCKDNIFGYLGWPSIARCPDGRLIAAASGMRVGHVCPFGKSMISYSSDEGKTWTVPAIANDTPLDDRDTGIINIGDGRLALTWFTNSRAFQRNYISNGDLKLKALFNAYLDLVTDEMEDSNIGSFIRYSDNNGGMWSDKVKVPVSTPHGPILLKNGKMLYFGKELDGYYPNIDLQADTKVKDKFIAAYTSDNKGQDWMLLGKVPLTPNTISDNFHEPHAIELENGDILGFIRTEGMIEGKNVFTLYKTMSQDGGYTWSIPEPTGINGSPPHLIRHSSGAVICSYADRNGKASAQKVMISNDECKSWEIDYIIDDRAVDGDIGYPASQELNDGSILTLYYQKYPGDVKTSILYTIWRLPEGITVKQDIR